MPAQLPSEAPPAQPSAPEAPQPQSGGGSAQELVVGINDSLSALLAKVPDGEEKDELQGIVQGFQSWVDGMGQPAGAPKGGVAPVEAGASGAKPAM